MTYPKGVNPMDGRVTHPEGPRFKSWPRCQNNQGITEKSVTPFFHIKAFVTNL
jgi:hypothetical protein